MRIKHVAIQLTLEARPAQKPWTARTKREAAELCATARLADTWDTDLDPEVSAQLVKANVRAYLSWGKEKGKSKGKGKLPVRSTCLPF